MWKLDHKEGWAQKNGYFRTVVLEKTLESPLDFKEIMPVNPKGNQPWIFFGKTDAEAPTLWPPDMKSQLIGKDPDPGKDWEQEEKGLTEHEMVGWQHRLNGLEFEQTQESETLKDRKAWRAAVHGVTKSQTRLSHWTRRTIRFYLEMTFCHNTQCQAYSSRLPLPCSCHLCYCCHTFYLYYIMNPIKCCYYFALNILLY